MLLSLCTLNPTYNPFIVIENHNRNHNHTVWTALNTVLSTTSEIIDLGIWHDMSIVLSVVPNYFRTDLPQTDQATKLFKDSKYGTWIESGMYGVFCEPLSTGTNGGMSIAEAGQASLWILQLELKYPGLHLQWNNTILGLLKIKTFGRNQSDFCGATHTLPCFWTTVVLAECTDITLKTMHR